MFNIQQYLGIWYELAHYESWFQQNDQYNTTAEYYLENDQIVVLNSTISQGELIQSKGTLQQLDDVKLRVDFPMPEVEKLQNLNFKPSNINKDPNYSNYIVANLWLNQYKQYIFAIVTDEDYNSLYILSRYKHPSLEAYNEIMTYVVEHYDVDRLRQTPHFD